MSAGGLGLYVSHQIVKAHGGTIWAPARATELDDAAGSRKGVEKVVSVYVKAPVYCVHTIYWSFCYTIYMDYLFTLQDQDIFIRPEFSSPEKYEKRMTVKAVVINSEGKYGFVTNPIHGSILLAGGGAESNNLEKEIVRECAEELFQEIKVMRKIGVAHEFRNRNNIEYETVCYFAKTIKETSEDARTIDERKNGLQAVWLGKQEALNILKKQEEKVKLGEVEFYNTAFNIVRDLRFFEEYLKVS